MISEQDRKKVRDAYAAQLSTVPREIEAEIEHIGGTDMLLERIDVMAWAYNEREELKQTREVVRMMDGEKDIDRTLIAAAIQDKRRSCQSGLKWIDHLKREIARQTEMLDEAEKTLEENQLALNVLMEMGQEGEKVTMP